MARKLASTQIPKYPLVLWGVFLLLFTASAAFAQQRQISTKDKKAIKAYTTAEYLVENRRLDEAVPYLQEAIKRDPNFIEAYFKLAGIYMTYGKLANAKPLFMKGSDLDSNRVTSCGAYFTAGELCIKEGEYEQAQKYFRWVIRNNPNNKKMLTDSPRYLETCAFAIEAKKNPIAFSPQKMAAPLNQFYMQAYPVLTVDRQELIFMIREGSLKGESDEQIYSAQIGSDSLWQTPKVYSDQINSRYNEGAVTISGDGKTLAFASCNRPDAIGSCDLYISYKTGDLWSEPVNMGPNVNAAGWDSEPSISADGQTIYFASERRGGFGKEDIWVAHRKDNGEWGLARNLGNKVNSPGREVGPFIHADGQSLYFSSNYHLGMGQFDIFISRVTEKDSCTAPINLGYPINTHQNDVTPFITVDGKEGFYSAYDKANFSSDMSWLYTFKVPTIMQPYKPGSYVYGKVYDAETKKVIAANIEVIDLKAAWYKQKVKSDASSGAYAVVLSKGSNYGFYASAPGYLYESISISYENPENFNPKALDIYLKPLKKGSTIQLNTIFFESNSAVISSSSNVELEKLLQLFVLDPNLKVELSGHTDDVGADQQNKELSTKRAKAVYDWLIAKGIASARLSYKGFGETMPLVPNTSEENRALNRRLEFKIL
jgi:OOP family OmpA-OmpF porin